MNKRPKKKNLANPSPSGRQGGSECRRTIWGICIFLVVITLAVFGQTLRYEFVNFDDDVYVYKNPVVSQGLNLTGMVWAFTHFHYCNWHPLTTLSQMLDCQLWGLHAGGHHLTNVLLHAATTVLLFLVLRQMTSLRPNANVVDPFPRTGTLWASAFVAAVFAIHPLQVESVAWISDRKDLLSGLFFMLTLGAYLWYARHPGWHRYLLVFVCYAFGLMSKAMLVTLPLLLLLLDYWPLGRLKSSGTEKMFRITSRPLTNLILEKLPLGLLACIFSFVAFIAQQSEGAVPSLEELSFYNRLVNASGNYIFYILKTLWPTELAIPYPMPPDVSLWRVLGSGLVLTLITTLIVRAARRFPYLLVGWLWYLGMLVPVIGLIQVGGQSRADRYACLPQIGLCFGAALAVMDWTIRWRWRRQILGAAALSMVAALAVCAWIQTSYWRNSESLWRHTLACTSGNYVAYDNLGVVLADQGRLVEAADCYQKALKVEPDYSIAHNHWGLVLVRQGQLEEAIKHYQKAIETTADYAEAYNNLGNTFFDQGRPAEAIEHLQKAIMIKPDFAEALNNLGGVLVAQGRVAEAIQLLQKAIVIKPDFEEAHNSLGKVYIWQGRFPEAARHFEKALEIKPDFAEACYNLGRTFAAQGQIDESIQQYRKALQIKPNYLEAHNKLANALSSQGKIVEAIEHYQQALQIKPDFAEVHNNLGNILARQGRFVQAAEHFEEAIKIKPDFVEAYNNLGSILAGRGRIPEAIKHFQRAIEIEPDNADTHFNLGQALQAQGRITEAIEHYERAVTIKPEPHVYYQLGLALQSYGKVAAAITQYQKVLELDPRHLLTQNNLAWLLATSTDGLLRNGVKAVKLAQQAEQLSGGKYPGILDTLAAAYAEAGQFEKAIETAKKALDLSTIQNDKALADAIQSRLKLYEANLPYHERPGIIQESRPIMAH